MSPPAGMPSALAPRGVPLWEASPLERMQHDSVVLTEVIADARQRPPLAVEPYGFLDLLSVSPR